MEIQEFPKALYLGGQQIVVEDSVAEDAARESGYLDWHDDYARLTEADEQAPVDREALKARAAELGLTVAPNIPTKKLAELIASAEAGAQE